MVKRIFCVAAFGFVLTANVSAQDAAVGSSDSAAASAVNEVSSPVKAWEGKITMPTYLLDWRFEITADRFLRNMVRAIVGTLLEVGRGRLDLEGFRQVITEENRCRAGESVPAHGLSLVDVAYDDELGKALEIGS